ADALKVFRFHKDTYSTYWRWSDETLERLRADGVYEVSGDGWALRLDDSTDKTNAMLTARNFPIQGTASAIMLPCVPRAPSYGIQTSATLLDAVLAIAPASKANDCAVKLEAMMRDVSREFLGSEVKVSTKVFLDRFEDEDGRPGWDRVSELLVRYE